MKLHLITDLTVLRCEWVPNNNHTVLATVCCGNPPSVFTDTCASNGITLKQVITASNISLWVRRFIVWPQRPGQTDPTCWSNIIEHFELVWPPCCTMLNEVWFPFNIVFDIIQHFFCSSVWTKVLHWFGQHVQQCWTLTCPLSWLFGYLFPWQWFTVYACFVHSAWMLRYGMVNEESFQPLRRKYKRSLYKLKKKGQSSCWKPENCEIATLEILLRIAKFLMSWGIVELLLIFRLQL